MDTVDFDSAFRIKYGDLMPTEQQKEPPTKFGSKTVEFVGMDKVASKIQTRITELDLAGLGITDIGSVSGEVIDKLHTVEVLNLSQNRLRSWLEVVRLVEMLPKLNRLVVSGNPLEAPSDQPLSDVLKWKQTMANVKTVVFGQSEYSWHFIQLLESHCLSWDLEHLDVFKSKIEEICKVPSTSFMALRHLNLSENPILNWDQVNNLGQLPLLQTLILNDCNLNSVNFQTREEKTELFANLEILSLRGNRIGKWIDIAQLNKLPALIDLNVKSNPIFEGLDYAVAFNFVLCRIEGLQVLNREHLVEAKRKEAARYYIGKFYDEWLEKKDEPSYKAENPCFVSLLRKYGDYDDEEQAKPPSKAHISEVDKTFVQIRIQSEDDQEGINKQLPMTTTVFSLKVMVKRAFNIDPADDVNLLWINPAHPNFKMDLDDDHCSLHQLCIDDGSVIVVKPN